MTAHMGSVENYSWVEMGINYAGKGIHVWYIIQDWKLSGPVFLAIN